MSRLSFHSRPQGASPKRTSYAPASHFVAQARDRRYRRACFELLEERRALATVSLGTGSTPQLVDRAPLAQFEAAAFPRVIQINANLSLATDESPVSSAAFSSLRPTRQQEPRLVLPSADGRPVSASIDRIQATAGIKTNVQLYHKNPAETGHRATVIPPTINPQASTSRAPATEVKPIGRALPATPLPGRSEITATPFPANVDAKRVPPPGARANVADTGNVAATNRSDPAPPKRTFSSSTDRPTVDYTPFESQSSSLTRDDAEATDLLFKRPRRVTASSRTVPSEDSRDYLSNTQTVIFAAAAAATALVLPGIVSEIRRRRKRTLPQFARDALRTTQTSERPMDQAASTYSIREKAG
jgi:hypothetical protein